MNTFTPILKSPFGNIILGIWHPPKALSPIDVTELCIITDVKPLPLNVYPLIIVNHFGSTTVFRDAQVWNADAPIVNTESGMITEVIVLLTNALAAIVVTLYVIPLASIIVLGISNAPVIPVVTATVAEPYEDV